MTVDSTSSRFVNSLISITISFNFGGASELVYFRSNGFFYHEGHSDWRGAISEQDTETEIRNKYFQSKNKWQQELR